MFGQQKNIPFGGTSFGQSGSFNNTTPFGSTGATSFGGGGFGATPTQPAGGLFGSTPAANTGGGLFGGGATSSFSQPQQNTSFNFSGQPATNTTGGGLFGSSTPAGGGGLFGTPTTSSAFGAKTPGAGFAGSGGLFGNNNNNQAGGLFGSTNTAAAGGSLFGGGNAFATTIATNGTTIKFNPPNGTDTMIKGGVSQNINTRHQCITAMKEYKDKCVEELRLEDYTANRKGPQAPTGGLFQPQQSSFSFGGLGSNTSTSTTGGGLFGGTQSTAGTGGLFGQNQNKALFGTNTATSSTGFTGFGTNTASTSLFGQNNQQKPGGLFGATTSQPSTGGLFGQPSSQPSTSFGGATSFGGGFGTNTQQQQQTGGLFGTKPTGFGTNTSTGFGFGQNTAAAGGIFSKPATTATNTFSFGQQNATTGFGQTNTAGSLFGNKPTGFGTTTNTFGGTTGGFGTGLGGGLGTGTGLFSNQAKPTLGTGLGGTGFGTNTGFNFSSNTGGLNLTGTNLGNVNLGGLGSTTGNSNAVHAQFQQQILALANSPYGDSPLFRNIKQDESKREEALKPTNPAAQKAVLSASSQYRISPKPTAKIKPKPIQSLLGSKNQLFEGLDDDDSTFGNDTLVPRKSIKKLIINSKIGLTSQTTPGKNGQESPLVAPSPILAAAAANSPAPTANGTPRERTQPDSTTSPRQKLNLDRSGSKAAEAAPLGSPDRDMGNSMLDDTLMVLKTRSMSSRDSSELIEEEEDAPPHPAGIVLRRVGYYTMPSLEELADMVDENGDCWVENFVVGRQGYGNVFFPGMTNVAGINLDEIIHFRRKEITVYPDDTKKPKEGEGLNKPAQVTLDCVWPRDKASQSPIKNAERLILMNYQERIENASAKIGAKFIDYRPETGSWVFEVKHFSKYGLPDDSDDEDYDVNKDPQQLQKLKQSQKQQLIIQKKQIAMEEGLEELSQDGQPQQQQGKSGDVEMRMDEQVLPQRVMMQRSSDEDSEMQQADSTQDGDDLHDDQTKLFEADMELTECAFRPTSHQLATNMGVDSRQVQVMKASFFNDDDMDIDTTSRVTRPLAGSLLKGLGGGSQPSSPLLPSPKTLDEIQREKLNATSMRKSFMSDRLPSQQAAADLPKLKSAVPSAIEHMLIPSGMSQQKAPHKLVGSRIVRELPALSKSLMGGREKLVMDMGLVHSRSCRVGWGPELTMVHSGQPVCHDLDMDSEDDRPSLLPVTRKVKKRIDASPFTVQHEQVHLSPCSKQYNHQLKNVIEASLELQLQHSKVETDTGCPCFTPAPGIDSLHKHAEHTESVLQLMSGEGDYGAHHLVWQLCVALWGRLPDWDEDEEIDQCSYAYHMSRREAVSKWLSAMSKKQITQEVQEVSYKGKSHIQSVLSKLSGRDISSAVKTSQEAGDHHMALLLAQTVGSAPVRQMVAKQLANWQEHKADRFIDMDRLRVYTIIAGLPVWQSTIGDINSCEGLDWKRCLAMHLWYLCSPSTTIAEALHRYEEAFSGKTEFGQYAASPQPLYLEDEYTKPYMPDDKKHVVYDMCYHVLKLYSDRAHPLDRLLAPTTYTSNHLDFSLSWLVWQVLQSLGYTQLSEARAAGLCSSFASQLEFLGLWHWAAFILLHIPNIVNREHAVKRLLAKHITLSSDPEYMEKEIFLLEKLLIPPPWVHQAKAWVAKHQGCHDQEAWHLLKAGHWNSSHRVLLRHVAARAIINEKYGLLKKYLCEMSPVEYSSSILDWAVGGKVFLDFITMIETLDEIKHGDISAYELEKLEPEVTSLCNRIGKLECHTSLDMLCQSEMAKRTANVLRTLLMLRSQSSHPQHDRHVPTKLLAPHVTKLPIPEDYALQELRDLTRSYMLEMTSSNGAL